MATRAEAVYQRLRADILAGKLRPGERLPFASLTDVYEASTGVLREALPRLVEQGLVFSEAQIGFRVADISVEDLRHLTEARILIETMALRQSIEHGDVSWESRLLAVHHTLTRTPLAHDGDSAVSEEWRAAHADYHSVLAEACLNPRLQSIANGLRDAAELYRSWSRGLRKGADDVRDVAAEHRRILEATLARDATEAVQALTDHIQHTSQALLDLSAPQASAEGGPDQR